MFATTSRYLTRPFMTCSLASSMWNPGWHQTDEAIASSEASRQKVEAFIRECFAEAYGSQLQQFMPRLFGCFDAQHELLAAFGLRSAAKSALFLETYLNQPIEQVLQAHLGQTILREEIIEVGNLATYQPGSVRGLIARITMMLHRAQYKWVVFTGTTTLRNSFHRLGLKPMTIGAATLASLPEAEHAAWGSYYAHYPMVMVGNIQEGFRALSATQALQRSPYVCLKEAK